MQFRVSRRQIIQGAAAAAALTPAGLAAAAPARPWPIEEGPDTPKICLGAGDAAWPPPMEDAPAHARQAARNSGFGGTLAPKSAPATDRESASYRRIAQLGVTHLAYGNVGPFPWQEENIRRAIERAKQFGLTLQVAMVPVPASILYARRERSADLEKVIASIQAAGKAGLPVVEYNFYAHRIIEGYYEQVGRAGAGYTAYDSDLEILIDGNGVIVPGLLRDEQGKLTPETLAANPNARRIKVRDLPPLAGEGTHSLDEMWTNITYFLKAAVPAAEKAGTRLALHPNDPPAPVSRRSGQIMGSLAGWKHLIGIVDSPANGITFDCGVTREMGEDPVATAEYFASRKRINHCHYRNVTVVKPYDKYSEVFIDTGVVDMFGVMRALVRNKYSGTVYPEHPRALDYDRDRGPIPGYPGGGAYGGFTYNVAYARAMLQAALASA